MNPFAAALTVFPAAAGGCTVAYTGAGLAGENVSAVKSDVAADEFPGPGATARHISFEIGKALLPERPAKRDVIVDAAGRWSVIEVASRDDVSAWVLSVEEAE